MTLSAGRTLCPWLIARAADPPKYRQVHSELATLLQDYSPHVISKSIDEFCLILPVGVRHASPAVISTQIKSRIKSEIGDYLRVSIGVSTNQILAKLVAKATRRMRIYYLMTSVSSPPSSICIMTVSLRSSQSEA